MAPKQAILQPKIAREPTTDTKSLPRFKYDVGGILFDLLKVCLKGIVLPLFLVPDNIVWPLMDPHLFGAVGLTICIIIDCFSKTLSPAIDRRVFLNEVKVFLQA
jgi:hypothetical protein